MSVLQPLRRDRWRSLGPTRVTNGQAKGRPPVSGRINGIAVSKDRQRIYAASSNGGVWRSLDGGVSWTSIMDAWDQDPQEVTSTPRLDTPRQKRGRYHGADSLACGDIALAEGESATSGSDRLYVGSGEAYSSLDSYFGVGILTSSGDGGVWHVEDGPPESSLVGKGCYQLAIAPGDQADSVSDPDVVYAATRAGLYKRVKNQPWALQTLPGAEGQQVTSVVMAAGVVYAATEQGRVFKNTDFEKKDGEWKAYGASTGRSNGSLFPFTAGTDEPKRVSLAVRRDKPNDLHALSNFNLATLMRCTNETWQDISPWLPTADKKPGNKGDDTGWHKAGHHNLAIAVDPVEDGVVYVGMASRQFKTRRGKGTGGALYRCKQGAEAVCIGDTVHPDIHALEFDSDEGEEVPTPNLWVTCDGGVFMARRSDYLSTGRFKARNDNLATLTLEHLGQHPMDPNKLVCGSQDNGCLGLEQIETGQWKRIDGGDSGVALINWHRPESLLISTAKGDLSKREGSGFPIAAKVPLDSDEDVEFYPPLAGVPFNPDSESAAQQSRLVAFGSERVWISTDFGRPADPSSGYEGWLSTDAGSHAEGLVWNAISGKLEEAPARQTRPERYKSLAFANARMLYAGTTKGRVFRIEIDGNGLKVGTEIELTATKPFGVPVTSIAVDPGDDTARSIYITLGGTGSYERVHRYNGAKNQWQAKSGPAPGDTRSLLDVQHNAIVVHPDDPKRLYAAADIGVWHSQDGGDSWSTLVRGLPEAAVLDLKVWPPPGPVEKQGTTPTSLTDAWFIPHRLRAATHGRGAFEIALDRPLQQSIDVVFVLDCTGSMSGLIDTAKLEIVHIAEELTKLTKRSGQPDGKIRVGLIRYRDRGDDYVVHLDDLTDNLDAMYTNLRDNFNAAGGGDERESVNKALYEAVNSMDWPSGSEVYKVVFLVGDAPPHMDREFNVYETATQAAANEIVIHTVQCGSSPETRTVWQGIAKNGNGHYHALPQSGEGFKEKVLASINKQIKANSIGRS